MPGWGWLLLGAGSALIAVLVIWLLTRKSSTAVVDQLELVNSERKRLEAELAAETKLREDAERIRDALALEVTRIAEDQQLKLEALDEATKKDFLELAGDPDALLARLDRLLSADPGTRPPADVPSRR